MKLKDLPTKYDFKSVEAGKYEQWVKKGYFKAGDKKKKPFAIVIPPPNITGKLHMGHVLDTGLQDIIIRRKRMQGYDALYVPGMDHASIATQTRVEAMLKKQGVSRYDLGREKFLDVCREWKEEHTELIRRQWAVIGLSVDYSRERFTLDEGLNKAVNEVFIRMYNEGLIYRGERIINWDIQSKTALSNIEVEYHEIAAALYYVTYPFADGAEGGITIATTRPETMFADVALMVNPKDERYTKYIGKTVVVPVAGRAVPVIGDDFVDMEFGTGAVKVTPAHDPDDFQVGLRHNLPMPSCMNEDGTMNGLAGKYAAMERFACRKAMTAELSGVGALVKVENIVHAVGHSERTGVIVEPRLSKQWFVAMDALARAALEMQKEEGGINFIPARFEKIYNEWLKNIQDWCISRQLWWGHRIPAWYRGAQVYVGHEAPEEPGWIRDEDTLDTWFSSALWPFSSLGWPDETPDLKRYFPTDVLVTGYDLIFFWIARMVFQSKYLLNVRPFKHVFIHGLIRDEGGRKVSKSLGNYIDMEEITQRYGMDSLRYFLCTTGAPGQDIRFFEEKVEAAWNYINKIWNASRYIGISLSGIDYRNRPITDALLSAVDSWILTKLNELIDGVDTFFEKYDFGEAARLIYKFVWTDFTSRYLEMTKVIFSEGGEEERQNTGSVLSYVLSVVLRLLHPIMPYFTEEIYQRFNGGSICVACWPEVKAAYTKPVDQVEALFDIITAVRSIRGEKNVSYHQPVDIEIQVFSERNKNFLNEHLRYLRKMLNYRTISITLEEADASGKVTHISAYAVIAVPLAQLIDIDEEKRRLNADKQKTEQEIARCRSMLDNRNFIKKAPAEKVAAEREKLAAYEKQLSEIINVLGGFER